MLRLADGRIASLFGDVALRIDPSDGSVEAIGIFEKPPRDWIFLGDDLYLILDTDIARVRDFRRLH